MELKFGKFNGQEIDKVAQSEEGRNYLKWLIDQPVKSDKWETVNLKRNKVIKEVLEYATWNETSEDTEEAPESLNDTSNEEHSANNVKSKINSCLDHIMAQVASVRTIVDNLDEI